MAGARNGTACQGPARAVAGDPAGPWAQTVANQDERLYPQFRQEQEVDMRTARVTSDKGQRAALRVLARECETGGVVMLLGAEAAALLQLIKDLVDQRAALRRKARPPVQ
jgi:hypothetical protein